MKWVKQCKICGNHYNYEDDVSTASRDRTCKVECQIIYFLKFGFGSIPKGYSLLDAK